MKYYPSDKQLILGYGIFFIVVASLIAVMASISSCGTKESVQQQMKKIEENDKKVEDDRRFIVIQTVSHGFGMIGYIMKDKETGNLYFVNERIFDKIGK